MSGGRSPRQKGNRAERALVAFLQNHGFAAERVPLSGAARGRFGGDISIPLLGIDRRVEVKARGIGFRRLYDWLGNHDFLIVKADRLEPLVVLRLKFASEIAALAEQTKNSCEAGSPPGEPGKTERQYHES
jgi:Holliday junction resolvase